MDWKNQQFIPLNNDDNNDDDDSDNQLTDVIWSSMNCANILLILYWLYLLSKSVHPSFKRFNTFFGIVTMYILIVIFQNFFLVNNDEKLCLKDVNVPYFGNVQNINNPLLNEWLDTIKTLCTYFIISALFFKIIIHNKNKDVLLKRVHYGGIVILAYILIKFTNILHQLNGMIWIEKITNMVLFVSIMYISFGLLQELMKKRDKLVVGYFVIPLFLLCSSLAIYSIGNPVVDLLKNETVTQKSIDELKQCNHTNDWKLWNKHIYWLLSNNILSGWAIMYIYSIFQNYLL